MNEVLFSAKRDSLIGREGEREREKVNEWMDERVVNENLMCNQTI